MINKNKSTCPIAIVLGPKCVNAVGLIRSLGEAGNYVIFASTYSKIESKYTSEYLKLPSDMRYALKVLLNYVKALPSKPAIYTVSDDYNYLIDEKYEELSKYCYIPHAKGRLKELSDKTVMAELAIASGLNVADFEKIDIAESFSSNVELPVIVKPYAGYAGSKGDIRICNSRDELDECIDFLRSKGYKQAMLQHLICGSDQFEIGLMGISLSDGTVEIPCTIRKVRSYPEGRGSTSYAQIKNGLCGVSEEALKSFVRSTGYIGIFDIEMIISDGKAYFIEINYRNGQYGYSVTKAGYNLPNNWFLGMMGEVISHNVTVNEIFYMNEREDKLHVKEGRLSKSEWKSQFKSAEAYGTYCKGDQRPFVRQYVKIPDRVVIMVRKIFSRISDLLVKEEWNVAIRKRSSDKLLYEDKNAEGFEVIKNDIRYWCADPFIISKDGKDYLFVEAYDRFKAKGVIGYREIDNGKIGKLKIAMELEKHLSFPNVFEHDGKIYMMPESNGLNKLSVYEAIEFPDRWEEKTVLLNESVVDSVFLKADGEVYILTKLCNQADFELVWYRLDGKSWILSDENPIASGKYNSRMGGAIIERNGHLIRVAQDCEGGYGLALNFNELSVDNGKYSEKMISRIDMASMPGKISKKYVGIHTYNLNNNYEVIDLKNKNRFKIGNAINVLYRIFSKGSVTCLRWIIK